MNAPENDSIICWRGIEIPRWPAHYSWCYLICFDEPFKQARHYLGSTVALDFRLRTHQAGNGARLLEVLLEHHITWELVRLWRCDTPEQARLLEKKLKNYHGHGPALCPHCNPRLGPDLLVGLRQGHWPLALHARIGRRQSMNEPQFTMVKLRQCLKRR